MNPAVQWGLVAKFRNFGVWLVINSRVSKCFMRNVRLTNNVYEVV